MLIAIYSRKSKWTGRGDSVENQIAMCREYIKKNIEAAGEAEILVYEDEGFSGKNTKRPQFQTMLADMKRRHFQYLVCYRLDRLGRNVADLAFLIEKLNRENTEFISIRERFDTTTPMGKAMLYFSGVLAQMEREQIAERVRDNMLMLAKTGRWLGGNTPLGFEAAEELLPAAGGRQRKAYYLKVQEKEMKRAVLLFEVFLREQSLKKTEQYLAGCGIQTRKGNPYTAGAVKDILTNPVYCRADKEGFAYFHHAGCQMCLKPEEADGLKGFVSYGKTASTGSRGQETKQEEWIIALGRHEGIIDGRDYVRIQKLLEGNKAAAGRTSRIRCEAAMLSGILVCGCGSKMKPKYYGQVRRETEDKKRPENKQKPEADRRFSYRCPVRDKSCGAVCGCTPLRGNSLDCQVWELVLQKICKELSLVRVYEKLEERLEFAQKGRAGEEEILEDLLAQKQEELKHLAAAAAGWEEGDFTLALRNQAEEMQRDMGKLRLRIEKLREEKNRASSFAAPEKTLGDFRSLAPLLHMQEKRACVRLCVNGVVWEWEKNRVLIQ